MAIKPIQQFNSVIYISNISSNSLLQNKRQDIIRCIQRIKGNSEFIR